MKTTSFFIAALLFTGLPSLRAKTLDGKPLIVLIAGKPSHGPGEHEHNAGVQLLARCLSQGAANVTTKVHLNAEWPGDAEFAQADTVVIYSDGGGGHPMIQADHLASIKKAMDRGAGFVCLHYAVEYPADKGGPQALDWMGGFFEANWSVNPHWDADFKELPKHPISNGVKPFSTNDEWYFHMRFRGDKEGRLTHILSAIAPESTMSRPDGAHSGNPAVRAAVAAKKPQATAWAYERSNGGRGFGFTGGHFHKGWANNDQRKLVLNAIVWTAKVEVPENGVDSKVTEEDLAANLDPKAPRKPKPGAAAAPAGNPGVKPLFSSPVVHDKPVEIKVDLTGAKELYLVATDGGDGFADDWANWAEPRLVAADGKKLKLTDLLPKHSKVGWRQLKVNKTAVGNPLMFGGRAIEFGFSAHAPSLLAFDLPPGITGFEALGGVDNAGTSKGGGTVIFQVYAQNPGDQILVKTPAPAAAGLAERYGLEKAKQNMSTFKTPEGLQASLVAAEPMIQNPTSIDIDPRGRVWATECVNYRKYLDLRPAGDRVVILEDTNGDGQADKAKTFYQDKGLTNPLGLCVLPQARGTKVIVSAAPNVWLLTDKDGDDVADEAKVIFKVGGVWNYDHQIHAFAFGADGKFYFNSGNSITELAWPDGTRVKDLAGNEITNAGKPYRQGMVYRCDLDLNTGKASNVETLGHNFRNNYKVCVDSFGTMWQSDNDDDGNQGVRINYVMEYGNYGFTDEMTGAGWRTARTNLESEIPLRHWHLNDPGVVPNLLQTGGGSPTGILINEGAALGPRFKNQLIHCDAGPRTVRAYPVEKDGAGYKATMVDILTSTDMWYRPSDVAIAPDGSLLIADWYDPGVGGHAMGDHEPGKIMGRIYRVAATGSTAKTAAPDFSTPDGAIKALQSPNRATVYVAWRTLHDLRDKAEPALERLWKHEDPRLRARALGLLARIPGRQSAHLRAGLLDPDSDVRVAAVRLCSTLERSNLIDTSVLDEDHALVAKLVRDPSPQVRRQIALSLSGAKEVAQLWAALAIQHDGKDRWYLEALGIGAMGNEDACFDAWFAMAGEKWNTPAGRDILWRLRSAKAAPYLAKIIADAKLAATEKPRFLRAFDFLPASAEKQKALTQLATLGGKSDGIAREALTRLKGTDLRSDPALAAALDQTLSRAKGTTQFIDLVRDFGATGQSQALLDTALAIGGDPAAADAVRLLFDDPKGDQILADAFDGPKSEAVINLLGSTGTRRGITRLAVLAGNDQQSATTRKRAVKALARTQTGAETLVKIAKNGQLAPDLTATAGTALRLVQYAALSKEIDQLFPAPAALGGKPLAAIAELVKMKGDVAMGRAVFERAEASCITCHRIDNKGSDFGPALSEIGTKLTKEAIFDAIINPNTGLSMGFETTQLATKDGRVGMGIVRSETQDEIVLALPGGVATKFRKGDIVKREKLTTSMMPSGLNVALTQDDLINLVDYLASLKKK